MEKKPIKRAESLQALSREHHDGLLFSWKIRKGLQEGISLQRMKAFRDWFYKQHLLHHFEVEEKHLFPKLGNTHDLVKTALQQHHELNEMFSGDVSENTLSDTADLLQEHIRFEERVLFNEIQKQIPEAELLAIEKLAEPLDCGNWEDEFWK